MIILSTCSARPNFVKLAAVHHALKAQAKHKHVIVHTGQHYDPLLSDIFFRQLEIPEPGHNLGVRGGERDQVITGTEQALVTVLQDVKPDLVLVYGDVNGALGAARAAKQLRIKIGHVEAGLRSFDQSMPEELNRKDIDHLADSLFVTEQSGMDNLEKEKVSGQAILVGNTMIDTLLRMTPYIEKENIPADIPESFVLATLHRPSNVDDPAVLAANLAFLTEVSEHCPVVLPLHPRAKATIDAFQLRPMIGPDVHITGPFGYLQFLALLKKSRCILTDSGGRCTAGSRYRSLGRLASD